MSIKVVYNKFSDVCKYYAFGKKLLDEPQKIIDRLDEQIEIVDYEGSGFIGYGLFTVADLEQLNRQVEG